VEVTVAALTFAERQAVLVCVSDISERTQAEAALPESEKRFRTFVEAMPVGVVLLGPRASS
jgi:PAS domain-containing protein